MITTARFIATPPIPGNLQAAPGQAPPQQLPAPGQAQVPAPGQPPIPRPGQPPVQAQPATPPTPGAPPTGATPPPLPPSTYWAANGVSYATLPEIGQAVAAGRLAMSDKGTVNVQKIQFCDTAAQQGIAKAKMSKYIKNAVIAGVAGMLGCAFMPLAVVGFGVAAWNGYKAYEAHQAASQAPPPQNAIVEDGRIKAAPGTFPPQFTYEAVDDNSLWNIVPSHPFGYKQGVPLDQVH